MYRPDPHLIVGAFGSGRKPEETTTMVATIIHFDKPRGYGFLFEPATGNQFFFHITSCNFIPEVGQQVQFEVGQGRKGIAAVNVRLCADTSALAGGAA